MGQDDTTDKLFPHQMVPESREVELPIPLVRSPREEMALLRLAVEDALKAQNVLLGQALARLSPVPTAQGAFRAALPVAGRIGAIVMAALGLAEVVVPIVAPQWIGPLKAFREMVGAAP